MPRIAVDNVTTPAFKAACPCANSSTRICSTIALDRRSSAAKDIYGLVVKAKGYGNTNAPFTKVTDLMESIQISTDAKDQNVATQRGMEISIDGGSSGFSGGATTADLVQGIYIANNSQQAQTASYGIYLNKGTYNGFTADLRLQNGATINNPAAAIIK